MANTFNTQVEHFIAIGPFVWGRGTTLETAKVQMQRSLRGTMTRPGYSYVVYKVGPGTEIDGMGCLSYPSGGPKPEEVERRERKTKR